MKSTLKQYLKYAGCLLIIGAGLFVACPANGQGEAFQLPEKNEIVQIRFEFYGDDIGVFFLSFPPEVLDKAIMVKNLNGSFSAARIISGTQFLLGCSSGYSPYDTFSIHIRALYHTPDELSYLPETIIPKGSNTVVTFGDHCYKLNCEPRNDPWMPSLSAPFLFATHRYYLNPDNGKIIKGKRAIRSGRYSSCDLKKWRPIDPFTTYTDKNKRPHKGSELISKKRIKLKHWDMEMFGL